MAQRVVVLGGSGMLGSMVADVLCRDNALAVTATVRSEALLPPCRAQLPGANWCLFDTQDESTWSIVDDADWVVNAIGITKPLIHDDNPAEVDRAIRVNAQFPHDLGRRVRRSGARVLQIATDCVYSGATGAYGESDLHDALDVYGKTKSLGEARYPGMHHLRCSIIGPEPKDHKFLVAWFLGQPRSSAVTGYVNHRWNGVTTLQFARICRGVITHNLDLPHLQHVVPAGAITKADILAAFARVYGREDITIHRDAAATIVDRTLRTEQSAVNSALWQAAGYDRAPAVVEMIRELARYERRLARLD